MAEKLYTATDMGGGLQVINTPNPMNAQDLATKDYVDRYRNQFGPFVPLWENDYTMQCASANFTNSTTHMTTGPNDQTITKLYADTAIRVISSVTCYISNVAGSLIRLQCSVNGGAILDMSGIFGWAAGEHAPLPTAFHYFSPTAMGSISAYSAVNTTGAMTVAFYMYVSSATTNIATDGNDFASWTIAECKVS